MEEFYRISLKIKNKINYCRKSVPMYIIFSDQTYILSVTMCVSFIGSSRNRIIYLPILYGFCLEKSHAHVIWHHFANCNIFIRFSIQWWAVLFWIMIFGFVIQKRNQWREYHFFLNQTIYRGWWCQYSGLLFIFVIIICATVAIALEQSRQSTLSPTVAQQIQYMYISE